MDDSIVEYLSQLSLSVEVPWVVEGGVGGGDLSI